MASSVDTIRDIALQEYKWGFVTDIEAETIPKGLNEDVIRLISAKKNEPEFMLEWRLKAYRHWASLEKRRPSRPGRTLNRSHRLPGHFYYSAPKQKPNSPAWTKSIRSC